MPILFIYFLQLLASVAEALHEGRDIDWPSCLTCLGYEGSALIKAEKQHGTSETWPQEADMHKNKMQVVLHDQYNFDLPSLFVFFHFFVAKYRWKEMVTLHSKKSLILMTDDVRIPLGE